VDAGVLGEFRMEGRGHDTSLPHQHRVVAAFGEDFDAFSDARDAWGADKDHLQRRTAQGGFSLDDGGVDLAAVGVALDRDVEGIEAGLVWVDDVLGQHDGSSTSAEGGFAVYEVLEFLEDVLRQKFEKRGGLASGNDEAVDVVEVFGLADERDRRPEFFEAASVGVEIALEG